MANLFADFNMIMWIVGGVGLLLFYMGITKKGKDKQTGQFMLFGGIALVAVLFIFPTFFIDLGGDGNGDADADAFAIARRTVRQPVAGCNVEDTTMTISGLNKFTAAASSGTHGYKVDGGATKSVSDTTAFQISPGSSIEVLYMNEAAASTYFGLLKTYTVPCAGIYDVSEDLVQNGTITINTFNEEGNLIGSSEQETMTSGDVANLKIELRAAHQKGFPYGGILTLEMNGTAFDEENTQLTLSGLSVSKVPTPQVHTITLTERKTVSWLIGAFEGASLYTGTLILDVDDASTATVEDGDDMLFTWRPNDYFINEDTGKSFDGPKAEDEDNVATFGHSTTQTIYLD